MKLILEQARRNPSFFYVLRDVNHLLKLDSSNTVLLAQKQELLQQAIGDTEKKLEALEQAQEDVAKAFERGELGKDQFHLPGAAADHRALGIEYPDGCGG